MNRSILACICTAGAHRGRRRPASSSTRSPSTIDPKHAHKRRHLHSRAANHHLHQRGHAHRGCGRAQRQAARRAQQRPRRQPERPPRGGSVASGPRAVRMHAEDARDVDHVSSHVPHGTWRRVLHLSYSGCRSCGRSSVSVMSVEMVRPAGVGDVGASYRHYTCGWTCACGSQRTPVRASVCRTESYSV